MVISDRQLLILLNVLQDSCDTNPVLDSYFHTNLNARTDLYKQIIEQQPNTITEIKDE